MSQKRQQQEDAKPRFEGTPFEDKRRRRAPSFRSVVLEAMNVQRLRNLMEPVLEPLIRRAVKEEVDSALTKYVLSMKWSFGKDTRHNELRCLQLHFLHAISLPVFTGTRIEAEESNALKVALVNSLTGQVVSSGPECSATVEIVVLEGDFDGDEGENWALEEFKNNIVRAREGKKPLLSGDVLLNLKDGIGVVGDLSFTDNSSWTRSRKFRLGAKVVDSIEGIRIREARSESFIVRDHRGELYKKHHPPFLFDKVWRLEKIGKDGAFHKRLSKERVKTVKDFLILLFLDPTRLRNILGTGMSTKMWEVTVEHAQTCVLDKNLHLYNFSGSQQKIGVVFNVVGQVTALFSDGRYIPSDKLSETEKADARKLVIAAYRDWDKVVTFDDEAALMGHVPCSSIAQSSNLQLKGSSNGNKVLSSQNFDRFSFLQQNASLPDIMQSMYSIGGLSNLDGYFHSVDPENIMLEQPSNIPVQVANTLLCNADSMSQALCADEQLQCFGTGCSLHDSNVQSSADLQSIVSCFLPRPVVPLDKAQRRWKILNSVFKMILNKKNCGKKSSCRNNKEL